MSALSIRLPNSLHARVRELAAREGISINQLVATALAEKMSALMTEEHLEGRALRGDRDRYLSVLSHVADAPPLDEDRMPSKVAKKAKPPRSSRQTTKRRSSGGQG
jgi:hypothetical protein